MSGDGSIWKQLLPDEKVRAVKKMARDDMTARQIADALGTQPRHVRTLADNNNIIIAYHTSPDTLPAVRDRAEDMTDTAYSRKYAAWLKAVEGAKKTRLRTAAIPDSAEPAEMTAKPLSQEAPTYTNDNFLSRLRARAGQ